MEKNMPNRNRRVLLQKSPKLPLLITESADDFEVLHDSVARRFQARDIIERKYVDDLASIMWEIDRLRQCKVAMLNTAFRDSLEQVLAQMLTMPGQDQSDVRADAQNLAYAWFTDTKAKKQILELLHRFGLDETAIEAEAMRSLFSELEPIENMLTSLEWRYDKALGCIAHYRAILVNQLRESADLANDGKRIPFDASSGHPPAS
jgi:hypothetical protein